MQTRDKYAPVNGSQAVRDGEKNFLNFSVSSKRWKKTAPILNYVQPSKAEKTSAFSFPSHSIQNLNFISLHSFG